MDQERWKQVEELFNRSLDLPSGQRRSFVESNAGGDAEVIREVCSLLDSDEHASTEILKDSVRVAVDDIGRRAEGARVGPYRLIREIGRGGMGSVWLASRDDDQYRKQVAIKLVRQGMDTDFVLARFRRERQILAQLEHPNIARLLDGGTTPEGLPYIVMEYVSGTWITAYCDQRRLSVADRVRLFLPVCTAVDFAHRAFVVHRDLKPGNILVDEQGVPKLLDFGISKLLLASPLAGDDTITQDLRMLTPDFASPEQVLGDPVTVNSDVYSLGAVLYKLLSGELPHVIEKYTPGELERAICETEVAKASSRAKDPAVAKALAGDLDLVLARALQKDPARRYPSVEALAADLRAYLDFKPVAARPDTLFYRMGKFTRRNRLAVAAGSVVACSLALAAGVSFRQAAIARENLQQVRSLANSLITEIHDSVRDLPGATKARENIVKVSLRYLDTVARQHQSDPELDRELAAAYLRTGEIQGYVMRPNLGDTKGAIESFRRATALLERYAARFPADEQTQGQLAGLRQKLAENLNYSSGTKPAIEELRRGIEALETWRKSHAPSPWLREVLADLYSSLARLQRIAQDDEASLRSGTKAAAEFRALRRPGAGPEFERSFAVTLSVLGQTQARLNQPEASLASLIESKGILEELARKDPSNVNYPRNLMLAHSHVAELLTAHPKLEGAGTAEDAFSRMVSIARNLHEADPNDQRALGDYGIALMRWGRATENPKLGLSRLREASEKLNRASRANPGNLLVAVNLANAELSLARMTGTLDHYRAAREAALAVLGKDSASAPAHAVLAASSAALAKSLAARGDRAGAIALLEQALSRAGSAKATTEALHTALMARAIKARRDTAAALGEAPEPWNQRLIETWKAAASQPGFNAALRAEMERDSGSRR